MRTTPRRAGRAAAIARGPFRPCVAALVVGAGMAAGAASPAAAQQKLHYSYLWHLEQPIYWPDRQRAVGSTSAGPDRYEAAWRSIQAKDAGAANPQNNLRDIFGLDDRRAVYQWRVRDSVQTLLSRPEAGAQVSYSGGLIANIRSLAAAGQLGYTSAWNQPLQQARGWLTSGGKPRVDVVLFSFHHALLPLVDENTVRREIQLYKAVYGPTWGASPAMSRGLFPSEMAFSTRMIKPLAQEGVAWSIVSAEKVSRAVSNYPLVLGSGGANTDPPNRADQVNPAQSNWYRKSISRGCSPVEAFPYAQTPRRARHVDPETGQVYSMIVVPSAQSLSWDDGYAPIGLGGFDAINAGGGLSAGRPPFVLLAHDGDNAWGGGFSYYMEATPNLAASASAAGYVPTTVEQYLADHPVPADDFVHVEDGAWVNADGDFGAPQFINWNWPLLSASGQIDVENGWHVDARNWAVITAAQNRVEHAEAVSTAQGQPVDVQRVLNPETGGTTAAERAWHYFLGSLNSGYMYYGSAIDMEVKPSVACNEAARNADPLIAQGLPDATSPTVWAPQRHPWNPGSTNFGPQYGYQQRGSNGDVWIWTFAYDVSGLQSVTLRYRVDADGQWSLSNTENETYAGGPGVGPWVSVPMTTRQFPAGNVYSDPEINFFEMPQHIATQHWAKLVASERGLHEKLVDYYVEAVDNAGNVKRSPIQRVWIGPGTTTGGGGGPAVALAPAAPAASQPVTVTYDPAGRPLAGSPQVFMRWGINAWSTVFSPDVQMTLQNGKWVAGVTVPSTATELDLVFNNGAGTWDNNGGQDWRIPVQGGTPGSTWTIDGQLDAGATLVAQAGTRRLWAGLKNDSLYLACDPAGGGNDQFLYLALPPGAGAMQPANWGKAGQVAAWSFFMGHESTNGFNGWFTAAGALTTASVRAAAGAGPAGVLEGTVALSAVTGGPLPASVWAAAAAFATPDGGALQPATQVPAGSGNASLEAAEYLRIDLCRFQAGGCAPACYANCDGSTSQPALNALDFACFLGRYQSAQGLPPASQVGAYANCDGSTSIPALNALDFGCFLARYTTGCP